MVVVVLRCLLHGPCAVIGRDVVLQPPQRPQQGLRRREVLWWQGKPSGAKKRWGRRLQCCRGGVRDDAGLGKSIVLSSLGVS